MLPPGLPFTRPLPPGGDKIPVLGPTTPLLETNQLDWTLSMILALAHLAVLATACLAGAWARGLMCWSPGAGAGAPCPLMAGGA